MDNATPPEYPDDSCHQRKYRKRPSVNNEILLLEGPHGFIPTRRTDGYVNAEERLIITPIFEPGTFSSGVARVTEHPMLKYTHGLYYNSQSVDMGAMGSADQKTLKLVKSNQQRMVDGKAPIGGYRNKKFADRRASGTSSTRGRERGSKAMPGILNRARIGAPLVNSERERAFIRHSMFCTKYTNYNHYASGSVSHMNVLFVCAMGSIPMLEIMMEEDTEERISKRVPISPLQYHYMNTVSWRGKVTNCQRQSRMLERTEFWVRLVYKHLVPLPDGEWPPEHPLTVTYYSKQVQAYLNRARAASPTPDALMFRPIVVIIPFLTQTIRKIVVNGIKANLVIGEMLPTDLSPYALTVWAPSWPVNGRRLVYCQNPGCGKDLTTHQLNTPDLYTCAMCYKIVCCSPECLEIYETQHHGPVRCIDMTIEGSNLVTTGNVCDCYRLITTPSTSQKQAEIPQ